MAHSIPSDKDRAELHVPDDLPALNGAGGGRTDAERLDWLEANDYPSFERWKAGWGCNVPHVYQSLREAIDAEMDDVRA